MSKAEIKSMTVFGGEDQPSYFSRETLLIAVFMEWLNQTDNPFVVEELRDEAISSEKLNLVNLNDALITVGVGTTTADSLVGKAPDLELDQPLPDVGDEPIVAHLFTFTYLTDTNRLLRLNVFVPETEIDGQPSFALADRLLQDALSVTDEVEVETQMYEQALARLKEFIADELRQIQSQS